MSVPNLFCHQSRRPFACIQRLFLGLVADPNFDASLHDFARIGDANDSCPKAASGMSNGHDPKFTVTNSKCSFGHGYLQGPSSKRTTLLIAES